MKQDQQSYANHRLRFKPAYMLASLAITIATADGMVQFTRNPSFDSLTLPLLGLGCICLWWSVRTGDIKLQDRVILAEMCARWERVLGTNRRAEFEKLTLGQLIALRFASDAELPGLVAEVLAETTTEPDAIKRKIRDWQADHLRV